MTESLTTALEHAARALQRDGDELAALAVFGGDAGQPGRSSSDLTPGEALLRAGLLLRLNRPEQARADVALAAQTGQPEAEVHAAVLALIDGDAHGADARLQAVLNRIGAQAEVQVYARRWRAALLGMLGRWSEAETEAALALEALGQSAQRPEVARWRPEITAVLASAWLQRGEWLKAENSFHKQWKDGGALAKLRVGPGYVLALLLRNQLGLAAATIASLDQLKVGQAIGFYASVELARGLHRLAGRPGVAGSMRASLLGAVGRTRASHDREHLHLLGPLYAEGLALAGAHAEASELLGKTLLDRHGAPAAAVSRGALWYNSGEYGLAEQLLGSDELRRDAANPWLSARAALYYGLTRVRRGTGHASRNEATFQGLRELRKLGPNSWYEIAVQLAAEASSAARDPDLLARVNEERGPVFGKAAANQQLELQLFGTGMVRAGEDGSVAQKLALQVNAGRAALVLAYLHERGESGASAEEIANDALGLGSSRSYVRKVKSDLHLSLGQEVIVTRPGRTSIDLATYQLSDAFNLTSDLDGAEQALRQGQFEEALRLIQPGLLPREDSDWLRDRREALVHSVWQVLLAHVAVVHQAGDALPLLHLADWIGQEGGEVLSPAAVDQPGRIRIDQLEELRDRLLDLIDDRR